MTLTTVCTDAMHHGGILVPADLADAVLRLLLKVDVPVLAPQVSPHALLCITNSDILTQHLGIVTGSKLAHDQFLSSLF